MEKVQKLSQNKLVKKLKRINIVRWLGLHKYQKHIIILVAVALFFATNLLLTPISLRLDLSKGKAYTLSGSTKEIINNLDKQATITFFVSEDLPTRLQSLRRDVTDLLQEYDRASGNVTIRVVDPKTDTNAAQAAQTAGIQELQFSQLEQDKYALSNFYFGLLISYNEKQEALPQATDLGSLEYNITSGIYKLTQEALPQVAIVGKQPSLIPQIPSEIGTFTSVAERQFTLEYITPPETAPQEQLEFETEAPVPSPVPLDIKPEHKTALIFAKDGTDYTDIDIADIKDYIANKGNVMFFVNGVTIDPRQLSATATQSKLVGLLKEYGITIQNNLVLSSNSELVNVGNQQFTVYMPYPLWVNTANFNSEASYFSNVNQLSLLWPSSLSTTTPNGATVRNLVSTTPQSWEQKEPFLLNPQQIPQPAENQFKEYVVSAESTAENRGKVMVVTASNFIDDAYLTREGGNLEFVLNVLNDYASGGALSGIRQREVDVYPLPNIPEDMKQVFKYGNVLVLPGLFALYGVYRLMRRSRKVSL